MQRGMDVGKMHQESSKIVLLRVLIVVVVIAAIGGGYLLFKSKQAYVMTQAPAGQVVSDFPSGLIIESGVTPQNSYSLAYTSGNFNQPVVTYLSNWSMIQNVVGFGTYLRNNGWTVTHEADPLAKNTFYYATKDTSEVNITFADSGKTNSQTLSLFGKVETVSSGPIIQVTISYIKR